MRKIGSYNGIITEISTELSNKGVSYTKLCLRVGEELLPMIAFAEVSTSLAHVGPGVQLAVAGQVMDDGMIRVNFFNAPNINYSAASRKVKIELTESQVKLEELMDMLGADYVCGKFRELFKWEEVASPDSSNKFRDGSYAGLLGVLEAEAKIVEALVKEKLWGKDEGRGADGARDPICVL